MLSFSLFRAVFSKCVCCFSVYAAPPVLHEYLISVELNFSDAAALNHLNTVLNRAASPIGLNSSIQVSGINVTTGTGANPSDKPPKRSFRITIKDWVTSAAKTARIIYFSLLQFALWTGVVSSVDVRICTVGHVTSVWGTDPVTPSPTARAVASLSCLQTDNTVNQPISKVSYIVISRHLKSSLLNICTIACLLSPYRLHRLSIVHTLSIHSL